MTIGAVILGLWQWFAPADALISAPLVASALIAGDGVWTVPSAILALAKVTPPMCAQVIFLLAHISALLLHWDLYQQPTCFSRAFLFSPLQTSDHFDEPI